MREYPGTPLAKATPSHVSLLAGLLRSVGEDNFSSLVNVARIRIMSAVVDTNFLVNEVRIATVTQTVPNFFEAARVGSVRLYASTRVRDEVPRVLAEMAHSQGFGLTEARSAWRVLGPWITFVDPTGLPRGSREIRRVLLVDPDDVPTGQLIELLDPDVVLSADKHLAPFGLPLRQHRGQMKTLRVAYRDKASRDSLRVSAAVGGTITLALVSESLRAIARVVRAPTRKLPKPVISILLGALAVGTWQYVSERRRTPAPSSRNVRGEILPFVLRLLADLSKQFQVGKDADHRIVETDRPRLPAHSTRAYAARALSRWPGPLSTRWLVRRMKEQGYRAHLGESYEALSARLLRSRRLFSRDVSGRWSMRSYPPAHG